MGAECRVGEAGGRHGATTHAPEEIRGGANPAVQEADDEEGAVEGGDGVKDGVHECGDDPEPERTTDVHGSGWWTGVRAESESRATVAAFH